MKKRDIILISCCLFSLTARAQRPDPAMDKKADEAGIKLLPQYQQVKSWYEANRHTVPDIPLPPVIDPDCIECQDGDTPDRNQSIVDKFNDQAMQPEGQIIKQVLGIARTKELMGAGGNILPGDNYQNERHAPNMDKIDDYTLQRILKLAEQRLEKKALGMVSKYKSTSVYFLGGLNFYLSTYRNLLLLGYYTQDNALDNPDFKQWAKTYFDKNTDRLINQYRYNYYPGLLYAPRQAALMGIDLSGHRFKMPDNRPFTIISGDDGVRFVNQLRTFMHFKLKIKMEANGHSESGPLHASISGEAELYCKLSETAGGQSCYQWVSDNDNMIKCTVDDITFANHDGQMIYKGAKEFFNRFTLSIGLCEKEPQFIMALDEFGPGPEQYSVPDGGGGQKDLELEPVDERIIPALYMAIMTDAAEKRFSGMESLQSEMESLAQRGAAQAADPNYAASAQGKQDLQRMKDIKKQLGIGDNNGLIEAMTKVVIPFKLGSAKPVDQRIESKKLSATGWDAASITITMEQFSDSKDNFTGN